MRSLQAEHILKKPNPLTPFPTREGGTRDSGSPLKSRRGVGGEVIQNVKIQTDDYALFMNNLTPQQSPIPKQELINNIVIGQKVTPVKVQRAKELRREMTQEEKILWQHLRANQLNGLHFRRQQIIDGFIADFYCHAARLVIEVDGEIHQKQAEYDTERDRILLARGLRLLRIRNEEVRQNLDKVLADISKVCSEQT
jgi:very-short-patch-repair endonuclease